jgi:hypothetical protein
MRSKIPLALLALCSFSLWAGDKIQPLDIKPGLWEFTSTNLVTGLPAMPPDVLAKMTPEQRAKIEAAMGARSGGVPRTITHKVCITREKLDKQTAFNDEHKNCTDTVDLFQQETRNQAAMHRAAEYDDERNHPGGSAQLRNPEGYGADGHG